MDTATRLKDWAGAGLTGAAARRKGIPFVGLRVISPLALTSPATTREARRGALKQGSRTGQQPVERVPGSQGGRGLYQKSWTRICEQAAWPEGRARDAGVAPQIRVKLALKKRGGRGPQSRPLRFIQPALIPFV
jgi:hypothetical protein